MKEKLNHDNIDCYNDGGTLMELKQTDCFKLLHAAQAPMADKRTKIAGRRLCPLWSIYTEPGSRRQVRSFLEFLTFDTDTFLYSLVESVILYQWKLVISDEIMNKYFNFSFRWRKFV